MQRALQTRENHVAIVDLDNTAIFDVRRHQHDIALRPPGNAPLVIRVIVYRMRGVGIECRVNAFGMADKHRKAENGRHFEVYCDGLSYSVATP